MEEVLYKYEVTVIVWPLGTTYTGCPRRNVPDFGRVFRMLKYTDITQNTYVQSWTVTEVMAREKCGLLAGPRTVPVTWQLYLYYVVECFVIWREFSTFLQVHHVCVCIYIYIYFRESYRIWDNMEKFCQTSRRWRRNVSLKNCVLDAGQTDRRKHTRL